MVKDLSPEQIAQQQQDEKDMKAFNEGLQNLINKTGITIVPKIAYTEDGIRPSMRLARVKQQDPIAEAAAEGAKGKKNGKKK